MSFWFILRVTAYISKKGNSYVQTKNSLKKVSEIVFVEEFSISKLFFYRFVGIQNNLINEYINVPVGMLFPSNRRRFISSDAKSDWSTSYQCTTLTPSVLTNVPSPIGGHNLLLAAIE